MPNATCPGCGAYDPGDDVCIVCHFSPGEDTPPPKPTFTHWYHETSKERPQGVSMGVPSFDQKVKGHLEAIVVVHKEMDTKAVGCPVTIGGWWRTACRTIVNDLCAAISDEYPKVVALEPARIGLLGVIDGHLKDSTSSVASGAGLRVGNRLWAEMANSLVESLQTMHGAAAIGAREDAS